MSITGFDVFVEVAKQIPEYENVDLMVLYNKIPRHSTEHESGQLEYEAEASLRNNPPTITEPPAVQKFNPPAEPSIPKISVKLPLNIKKTLPKPNTVAQPKKITITVKRPNPEKTE